MLGPIFSREFVTVPRRESHHISRLVILLLLWVISITAWQATVGFGRTATLGETARFGLLLFQIITFVELTLLLFFSALSAASTVSQEKDRRTFVLLLMTDMRDYEIVVGKMLGSLLPIVMLLLVTMPVLAMLLLLGGVSAEQVIQAGIILLATSVAAGSLGGLIALWRDKTFQALALSVLGLVLYLCIMQGLGLVGALISSTTDWSLVQAWLDPYFALRYVLEPPTSSAAIPPAYGFALSMLILSALLNGIGLWGLRKWNPSGEPIMQRDASADDEADEKGRTKAHASPGKAREVWPNPVLWREICTLAYGRRPLLIKFAYGIVLALICYFALGELNHGGSRQSFVAAYGLVPVAILSLLLVSAQAVTSITSERDGKALDVLLATDISPKEFVFGKIGGILYNTKEFIIPPLLLAIFYAVRGSLTPTPSDAAWVESFGFNAMPLFCILVRANGAGRLCGDVGIARCAAHREQQDICCSYAWDDVFSVGGYADKHLPDYH